MARVRHRWPVADPTADPLPPSAPTSSSNAGTPDGSFAQADGPFRHYRRTLEAEPDGATLETTEYQLVIPWFGWLFALPTRRSLQRRPPRIGAPWWAPPDVLDERAASVLGLLAAASLAVGS